MDARTRPQVLGNRSAIPTTPTAIIAMKGEKIENEHRPYIEPLSLETNTG